MTLVTASVTNEITASVTIEMRTPWVFLAFGTQAAAIYVNPRIALYCISASESAMKTENKFAYRENGGGTYDSPYIEHWRSRSLEIIYEIRTLQAERQKALSVSGRPDSRTGTYDFVIRKIRELRAELKDIQSRLLMATYNDLS